MRGVFSFKRNFLFDLDGTLVDSAGAHTFAFVETLRPHHPDLAEHFNYAPFAGQPTAQVFAALGISAQEIPALMRHKQGLYREAMEAGRVALFPGVMELLGALQRAGRGLFVVTGASRISAERITEKTQVSSFFKGMITAEDVPAGKPSPLPYLRALEIYSLAASDCLAVEDGESGVVSAAAAGVDVVLIHPRLKLADTVSIDSFQALGAVVLE